MRANAWTTLEECAYLNALKPIFLSEQENRTGIGAWVARTAGEFVKTFPVRASQFDRARLTKVRDFISNVSPQFFSSTLQKLRTWFDNHTRDCVRGTDSRHVLDLSGKANRRPLPLQPAQAYSILYYAEGTPLYEEIHDLYDKYKEGDKATIAKVKPLLKTSASKTSPAPPTNANTPPTDATTPLATDEITPPTDATTPQTDAATTQIDSAPGPKRTRSKKNSKKKAVKVVEKEAQQTPHVTKFVVFQQAIIREKVKEMSDIEADAVETLIEDRYAAAIETWESPWIPIVKGKGQEPEPEMLSEAELENKFYQRYVLILNSTQSTAHISTYLQQHRQAWAHHPSCHRRDTSFHDTQNSGHVWGTRPWIRHS